MASTTPEHGTSTSTAIGEPVAISVRDVSKTFRIPHDRLLTLKERALHPVKARKGGYNLLHAVDDMSFDVGAGEFFGIVGRNGSGKSTLLKCIAGIYDTDRGEIGVRGRLSPFIELGVGFNPDLTARDNVIINAVMLGLSRQEARDRFDEIIAFAELEDFVDLRLKNYSSGMQVRLAFSVGIRVDADILLIDEVLAVGDAAFQQKCFEQFNRLKAEGRTIIFVTHDMYSVERYCDRVMLMENGRMVSIDVPETIAKKYNELNFGRIVEETPVDGAGDRYGDQAAAEVRDAWFEDGAGERVVAIAQGDPLQVCLEVGFHTTVEDPIFSVALRNEMRQTIFATSTEHEPPVGRFGAGETTLVRIAFENWLAPSLYSATPSVARAGPKGANVFDVREDLASVRVFGPRFSGGVADIPHSIEVERQ